MEDSFGLPALAFGIPHIKSPSAAGGATSKAHGVQNMPWFLCVFAECLIAEVGYIKGDRVYSGCFESGLGGGWAATVSPDGTTYMSTTVNGGAPVKIINRTTPAGALTGTAANWKQVIVPLAFFTAPPYTNV